MGQALLEFLFEVTLRVPGFLIIRWIRPQSNVRPDGCLVVVCGMVFWILVILAIGGLTALFSSVAGT